MVVNIILSFSLVKGPSTIVGRLSVSTYQRINLLLSGFCLLGYQYLDLSYR